MSIRKFIKKFYEKATLFFGTDNESIVAVRLVEASKIPCDLIGTGDIESPCLYYGFQKYEDLDKIKKFLEATRKK